MSNKKCAVIYSGKHGTTQRYAQWIAEACGADLIPVEQAVVDDLAVYEKIIYGGAVYAGRIMGIQLLKQNRDLLKNADLAVYTVGLTQPGDEAAFEEVLVRNFTREERQGICFFHFPGALDYETMNGVERIMMRVLKKSIEKKSAGQRSQFEKYILDSFGGKADFTARTYINPLVDWVKDKKKAEK